MLESKTVMRVPGCLGSYGSLPGMQYLPLDLDAYLNMQQGYQAAFHRGNQSVSVYFLNFQFPAEKMASNQLEDRVFSEQVHEDLESSFKVEDSVQEQDEAPKVSKRFWTKKEDQKLAELVEKYGQVRWTQISMEMPGRSAKRCRERWMNYLDQSKNHSNEWTNKDKWTLFLCYKVHGNKWSVISKLVKRGDNIIKNQVNCLKRKKMMPYQAKLREALKHPESNPLITEASALELELIEKLKQKSKAHRPTEHRPVRQIRQEPRPERNENRNVNISLPIPIRSRSSNFCQLPHYPVPALGNISNVHHLGHHHHPPHSHANSASTANSQPGPMFYPSPMGFFPFGFFY